MVIKCKAVMLAKYFKWLIVIGIIVCVVFFLWLKIDLSYLYLLMVLLVFLGLLISFYLNRNELEMIKIDEAITSFIFINKVFFKKKACDCQKNELQSEYKDGVIDVYQKHLFIARIREVALEQDDWNRIKKYFNKK